MESIKIPTKQAPSKVSRLQIQVGFLEINVYSSIWNVSLKAELEKREAAARGKVSVAKLVPVENLEAPIPENINRIVPEGEVARSVEEAIQVLK